MGPLRSPFSEQWLDVSQSGDHEWFHSPAVDTAATEQCLLLIKGAS